MKNKYSKETSNKFNHNLLLDTNLENGDAQTLQSANERINEPRSSSGNQPNQEQTNQEFLNAFILQLSTMNTSISDVKLSISNLYHLFCFHILLIQIWWNASPISHWKSFTSSSAQVFMEFSFFGSPGCWFTLTAKFRVFTLHPRYLPKNTGM